MEQETIFWEAPEYHHRPRSTDWYFAVGIIAVALAVTSLILKNFLFALIILIAAFILVIFSKREPRHIRFELSNRGILIDKIFYPYSTIESFWVEITDAGSKLLLKYNKAFVPHIIIPITEEVHPDVVREFLLAHMAEAEQHEPITQKLMEYIGF